MASHRGGYEGFVFSRTVGMKYWCCPACNQVNRTQMRPQTWLVKCSNEACLAVWAIGEVFYEILKGFKAPPPDTILPRPEPMRTGEKINQVYCAGCAQIIYKDVFRRALEEGKDPNNAYGDYEIQQWEKRGFERRQLRALERRVFKNPEEMTKLLEEVRRIANELGMEVVEKQTITRLPEDLTEHV